MPITSLIRQGLTPPLIVLCCALILAPLILATLSKSGRAEVNLSDDLIQEAEDALSLAIGKDLSADDQAWLRRQWSAYAADQPEAMVARLEALAVAGRNINAGTDPMALAELRLELIEETYCSAQKTSDPITHRFREIVAPDDLVLAADCVTGIVVTPFDVKAIARSTAMIGDLVGSPVDAKAIETQLLETIPGSFDDMPLLQQQRLLWAEPRVSALEAVWSMVDDAAREQLVLAARNDFSGNGDVAATALSMESAALQQFAEIAVVARAGDHGLKPAEVATFITRLEMIAGSSFSPGEQAEITDMIVSRFQEDPATIINNAADVRRWLDEDWSFGKDPATGEIRSWTADEQADLLKEQAAFIFCRHQSREAASSRRLIEIVYADNPVVEADCDQGRVTRESERVLAEMGGHRLTRGLLDAHRRAFEVIFVIRFSPDERRWFDDLSVSDMRENPEGLMRSIGEFRGLAAKVETMAASGPHINQQSREDFATGLHCSNKNSEPDVIRLFELISGHDPIIFEDCARQLVVRQSDIEGLIASLNFIAALGGFDPITPEDRNKMPEILAPAFARLTSGPVRYLSTWSMLSYWWSKTPIEIRQKTALKVREEVKSADEIGAYSNEMSKQAALQTINLGTCDHFKEQLIFHTQMASLRERAIFDVSPNPAGSPWLNPGTAFGHGVRLFDALSPLVARQCAKVWE